MRERLRAVPLFREVDDASLDELAALGRVSRYARKQRVFAEGEPYRGMFVVLSGLAVVYKLSAEGRMLILHVCRPGDLLAEVPLFERSDAGYSAHARTTRPSEILFLPRERFVPFLRTHPEVAWEMLRGFAARMKEMSLQLEGVTLREVSSRLARYLLREIEAAGAAGVARPELTLPLAKGSVASYLGTVHETLSRTLARLVRDRVIAVDGPRITVLDRAKLERLV
jgi:CRP/FNR family transcriptional regulator